MFLGADTDGEKKLKQEASKRPKARLTGGRDWLAIERSPQVSVILKNDARR